MNSSGNYTHIKKTNIPLLTDLIPQISNSSRFKKSNNVLLLELNLTRLAAQWLFRHRLEVLELVTLLIVSVFPISCIVSFRPVISQRRIPPQAHAQSAFPVVR